MGDPCKNEYPFNPEAFDPASLAERPWIKVRIPLPLFDRELSYFDRRLVWMAREYVARRK